MWRSILDGREFVRKNALLQIGSGEKVNIWSDHWVEGKVGLTYYSGSELETVSSIIDYSSKCGKLPILREKFDVDTVHSILSIPLDMVEEEDSLVWPFSRDGAYKVKGGYRLAKGEKGFPLLLLLPLSLSLRKLGILSSQLIFLQK